MCLPAKVVNAGVVSPSAALILADRAPSSSSSTMSSSTSPQKPPKRRPQHHHHYAPLIVQHNYHDHAQETAPTHTISHPQELQLRCSASAPFPIKLEEMLNRVEGDGFSSVVSWQPHGRCFVIHKMTQFKELLPRYFKLSKIASFQRQLNLYGFQRITAGMDKGGYYHEYFLRGKSFLAYKIQRIKVKGTGVRGKSNPDQEPDFWSMEWVGTQPQNNSNNGSTTTGMEPVEALQQQRPSRSVVSLPGSGSATTTSAANSSTEHDARKDSASVVSNEDVDAMAISSCPTILQPVTSTSLSTSSNTVPALVPVPLYEEAPSAESPEPAPISSASATSAIEMTWFGAQDSENNDDHPHATMLCEWGKPFYALDTLPSDLFDRHHHHATTTTKTTMPAKKLTAKLSRPKSTPRNNLPLLPQYEIQDQQYLDKMLDNMLKELQQDKKRVQGGTSMVGQVVSV